MITRVFSESDLEKCVPLFVQAFNGEPWNDRWTVQKALDYFQDIVDTPGCRGFVTEADTAILGFVLGVRKQWWSGDIFYLYEMCVDQACKGKGIGTQLMEATKTYLTEQGFSSIVLSTERTFPAAHFYEKQGFYESPDTRFYYYGL